MDYFGVYIEEPDVLIGHVWFCEGNSKDGLFVMELKKVLSVILFLMLMGSTSFAQNFVKVPIYGGEVDHIALCVSSPSVMYAGSAYAGFWISKDGGDKWKATNFYDTTSIGSDRFVVHPVQPNIVIARAGNSGNKLYRSTDYGQTWTAVGSFEAYNNPNIVKIVASEKNPGTFYLLGNNLVASDGVVYKSTDGGVTWTKTGFTSGGKAVTDLCVDINDTMYVTATNEKPAMFLKFESGVTNGALYRSADSGLTWTTVRTFDAAPRYVVSSSNTVAVATCNSDFWAGIYISTNNVQSFVFKSGASSTMGTALAVTPDGNRIYYLQRTFFVTVSSNTGSTWSDFVAISTGALNGKRHIWSYTFLIDPINPNNMYLSDWYENAFYKSTDTAVTWRVSNMGLGGLVVYNGCKDPGGNIYVLGRAGVFKSTDTGKTWKEIYNPSMAYGRTLQFDAGVITAATTNYVYLAGAGKMWNSTDGGTTWNEVLSNGYLPASKIVYRPDNPAIAYAGFRDVNSIAATSRKYLYKTTNFGATWTQLNLEGMSVQSLAIDPQKPTILYAGLGEIANWKGQTHAFGGLWKIVDDGISVSWSRIGLENKAPYRIVVDTASVIYAACVETSDRTMGPVYVSKDGGTKWNKVQIISETGRDELGSGIIDIECFGDIIYICTWSGVWASGNKGLTFSIVAKQKDIGSPRCLVIGSMYTGASRGFYKLSWTPTTGGLALTVSKPQVYAFPNPFNAKSHSYTVLKYIVPQGKTVTSLRTSIYNIAGELVYEFSDDTNLQGGSAYYYAWDGKNKHGEKCAEGVYIVVFASNLDTARTKVVLYRK